MRYETTSEIRNKSIIVETIFIGERNTMETIYKAVMDTQEQATREALIKLGWTPPES
jgi:hypothetical protein